jgi:hypothetical protein
LVVLHLRKHDLEVGLPGRPLIHVIPSRVALKVSIRNRVEGDIGRAPSIESTISA